MILALSAVPASASPILFERDLPASGLNLAGSSRSNIAPVQGSFAGTPYVLGDNFTLSFQAIVDSITVWIIGNCPVTSCVPTDGTPGTEFSAIQLFGGLDSSGQLSLLSSSYTSTHVTYTGGQNYLSANGSGLSYPIFQITFASLGLLIPGSQLYDFAVRGTPNSTNIFSLHASTASISGGIQQGADNCVVLYEGSPLAPTFDACAGNLANFANGADVNVLVTGTANVLAAVPEPGTIASVGLGVLALVALRQRRAKTLPHP